MLVHGMETGEHRAEILWPNGDHCRKTDGRIHRIASSDPIPELKHVGGVDAERLYTGGVGGIGDKMLAHSLFRAKLLHHPGARRFGVGHRLQRRERLRRNDKQRLSRIQAVRRLAESCAVHVRDKAERHGAIAERAQRQISHLRPEIGAADPDVDHVADALSRVPGPASIAHLAGELRHAVQHGVHVGHNVMPVDLDHLITRSAQRHVQHCAVLALVDLLAAKHRIAPGRHAALFCKS